MAVVDLRFWKIGNFIFLLIFLLILKVCGNSVRRRTTVAPTFVLTDNNITVHRGQLAVLPCRIDNLGPRTVAWRKVSKDYPLTVGTITFDPKEDIVVSYKKMKKKHRTQWDLNIKRAQPRHTGMYECQISATEVFLHHVYLTVLDEPYVEVPSVVITGTHVVDLYQKINLTCTTTGETRAPEDIDWFHKSHIIQSHDPKWLDRIAITKYKPEVPGKTLVSNLMIEISQLKDRGRYLCRSSNKETAFFDVDILVTSQVRDTRHNSGNTQKMAIGSVGYRTIANPLMCFVVLLSVLVTR